MNIYDVSSKAGVSIATVSRVMNGNTNVSEKTRMKVLKVMEEIGYTPNVFARGLGLNTMKTIGIMCTDSSDLYLANAVYFLERELRKNGYDSILCCTGENLENKKQYLNLLISKRVDALILIGSKFIESFDSDNAYILEAAKNIPIMLVNGILSGTNIYSTLCQEEDAIFNVTKTLISNNKKNIVYLYSSDTDGAHRKLEGFRKAHFVHDMPIKADYCKQCKNHYQSALDHLEYMYKLSLPIDAIITSDDYLAVGALKFAREHSINVPSDLEVVGFNNSILAECTQPTLSSIDSKVESLCITTVGNLMGIFEGALAPDKTFIPTQIVKRETTIF